MRQIVLDTETTGLEVTQGHRVIEIGCVELNDRRPSGRTFHRYVCPDREVAPGALSVHGITNEFLSGQPRFAEVAEELIEFLRGAELVIHNAAFDVGFLDAELARMDGLRLCLGDICAVLDTLTLARQLHPGQRNSLDALCSRYSVNNQHREKHGALLDAEILADVYLAMTGGQVSLSLDSHSDVPGEVRGAIRRLPAGRKPLRVIRADAAESAAHNARLDAIDKACESGSVWRRTLDTTTH